MARTPSKPRANHSSAAASWYCAQCKAFLCDDCIVEKITDEGFQSFCNVCGGLCISSKSVLPRLRPRKDEPAKSRGIARLAVSLIFNPVSTVSSLDYEMASVSRLLQISFLLFAAVTIGQWRFLPGQSLSTFAGFYNLFGQSAVTFGRTILFLAFLCLWVEFINKILKFSEPKWIYLFPGSYFITLVNMAVGIVASSLLQNNEIAARVVSLLVGLWRYLLMSLLVDDLWLCKLPSVK